MSLSIGEKQDKKYQLTAESKDTNENTIVYYSAYISSADYDQQQINISILNKNEFVTNKETYQNDIEQFITEALSKVDEIALLSSNV